MEKPFLDQEMRCSILSNANGDIVILYDQPLLSEIQWIEFNTTNLQLNLVHKDGTNQNLGIVIEPKMASNLKNGTEVQLALLQDDGFKSVYKTTLVIQDY